MLEGDLGDTDKALLNSILTGPDAMRKVYDSGGVVVATRDAG